MTSAVLRTSSRNRRRLHFAIELALLPLAWLPRRRGLWIFAYVFGFSDNPRLLFEHVHRYPPPAVRPVWLAQTEAEADEVRGLGMDAVAKGTAAGFRALLRAEVAVIGSGFNEVSWPLLGRTIVVQAWHGAPIKRIHRDFPGDEEVVEPSRRGARAVNALFRAIRRRAWARCDVILAQSDVTADRFSSAFGVPRSRVAVVGAPRMDLIVSTDPAVAQRGHEIARYALGGATPDGDRIVLYAPTWRDGESEQLLWESFDGGEVSERLAAMGARLILKIHPLGDAEAILGARVGFDRIHVCPPGVDVNPLLRSVDCLVTDYSAIAADYAVLGRPIVFYMPDLDTYADARGFYEEPVEWTAGHWYTDWPSALDAVGAALAGDPKHVEATAELARRFVAHTDAANAARATAAIVELASSRRAAR